MVPRDVDKSAQVPINFLPKEQKLDKNAFKKIKHFFASPHSILNIF
jgi:hypothetical protein